MSECIPWDALAEGYYQGLSMTQGRPSKDARLVIGAVIIKHKLCLSDEETVAQIQWKHTEHAMVIIRRLYWAIRCTVGKQTDVISKATAFDLPASHFLVMNRLILLRVFFALIKKGVAVARMPLLHVVERLIRYQLAHDTRRRGYLYQMATY